MLQSLLYQSSWTQLEVFDTVKMIKRGLNQYSLNCTHLNSISKRSIHGKKARRFGLIPKPLSRKRRPGKAKSIKKST